MKNFKMFKIYYFKKLASTNDKAKEFNENSIVISETQSKGRGRFNRKWDSGIGGLWMSIVLKPKIKNPKKMTFIAAVAVQKSIKKNFKIDTKIKWPNDILFDGKKLCGILTEAIFKNNNIEKMIIGIGLNVNNKLPLKLRNKAISLNNIVNKKIDIKKIANSILNELSTQYKKYEKNDKKILTDWKKLSDTIGRDVKIASVGKIYYGKAYSVDKDCNLLLKLKNNQKKKIIEGDIFY